MHNNIRRSDVHKNMGQYSNLVPRVSLLPAPATNCVKHPDFGCHVTSFNQGLSLSLSRWGGKKRDPGNEVANIREGLLSGRVLGANLLFSLGSGKGGAFSLRGRGGWEFYGRCRGRYQKKKKKVNKFIQTSP